MSLAVRRLDAGDAMTYRDIRLMALEKEPTAFASDPSLERGKSNEEWAAQLGRNFSFGVFDGREIKGIATYVVETRPKTRHRGTLVAVYVLSEARGTGAGMVLLETLVAHARQRVEQLHLTVTVGNEPAKRLYQRLGFQTYGTEPRALYVEGKYHDEDLMVLRLNRG